MSSTIIDDQRRQSPDGPTTGRARRPRGVGARMTPMAHDTGDTHDDDIRWGVRHGDPSAEISVLRLVDDRLVVDVGGPVADPSATGPDIEPAPAPHVGDRARSWVRRTTDPAVIEAYPLDDAYARPHSSETFPDDIAGDRAAEAPTPAPASGVPRVIAFARAGEGSVPPEGRPTEQAPPRAERQPRPAQEASDTDRRVGPPTATDGSRLRRAAPEADRGTARAEAAPIDPRMTARRAGVEDDRRRGRYRTLITVVIATLLLVAAVVGVLGSPLLEVHTITVRGGTEIGVDRVRDAAGVRIGQSMLDIDLNRVRSSVTELPLVERVAVRRRWPRTIVLDVVEAVPVAAVATGERWSVVDRRGTVLETRPVRPVALPQVVIENGTARSGEVRIRGALAVASLMSVQLRQRVARVAVRGTEVNVWVRRPDVRATRDGPADELLVLVGDPRDLDAKVRALETMLAGADLSDAAVLDLTVPDQPIVTPRIGGL